MGHIVGIDLGTTYSAVTIPEARSGEGFVAVRKCPSCSVILDALKRRTTPSAVAEDSLGALLIGYPAKNRAGSFPAPITFSKRYMGEDKTFPLAKLGELRPEEVAAHILRYLKEIAEQRLGGPVTDAVITVPAYFSLRAKQMTEQAGTLAGLRVPLILAEPVAAAMMYCLSDPRDPLRIMTYDLGGGTFDIAILEKRDGTISSKSILACDGDRFLGGYNFDKTLALWLMEQLNDQGYQLQLDLDNPADFAIFAKLMAYAERAKIKLSDDLEYTISDAATDIVDHAGNPVAVEQTITRDDFERMIGERIDYTLDLCDRALREKGDKPIDPDSIQEIVMVGGSSRIPLVGQRLEAKYGRRPQLVDPDLCVALGAGLAAIPLVTGGDELLRIDRIPVQTDLPNLQVTGHLEPTEQVSNIRECTLNLRSADGMVNINRRPNDEGGFLFDAVPLAPMDTTQFTLSVISPAGAPVTRHTFTVAQQDEPAPGQKAAAGSLPAQGEVIDVGQALAKPIILMLRDGPEVVAPERTTLPFETLIKTITMDNSGFIRIEVKEENNWLGELLISDIPTTLPIGSAVEVKVVIQKNFQILTSAYIPALGRSGDVALDIPMPAKKTPKELREDYEQLQARAQDALSGAGQGARFGAAKPLNDRLVDCRRMLDDQYAEPAEIQNALDEVETMVSRLETVWKPEPPRAVFEALCQQVHENYQKALAKHPEIEQSGYPAQIKALCEEADRAYQDQHATRWQESVEKLDGIREALERLIGDNGPRPEPTTEELLMALAMQLDALGKKAHQRGCYDRLEPEFDALAASLRAIDPQAPDARMKIRDWYLTGYQPLEKKVERGGLPDDDEGKVAKQKGLL